MSTEMKEKKELDWWKIGVVLLAVVFFIGMGLIYYLFFIKDEEEALIQGKNINITEAEQEELSELSVEILERAGNFGFNKKYFDSTENTYEAVTADMLTGSHQYPDAYTGRIERLEELKSKNLISPIGKVYFNTSRWNEEDEKEFRTVYETDNIEVEVPSKGKIDKNQNLLVEVQALYDSRISYYMYPMSEALPDGVEPPDYLSVVSSNLPEQQITLIFIKRDGLWSLFDIDSSREPFSLVLWESPKFGDLMNALEWETGEEQKITFEEETIDIINETTLGNDYE